MLYFLYSFFDINIFQYITFRAGAAFFVAFMLTLFMMPFFIKWARGKNANQPISDFVPEGHKLKSKTPTMGGLVFIAATIIASLLAAKLDEFFVLSGIAILLLFALLGVKDDMSKITQNKNAGMSGKAKISYQLFFAFMVSLFIFIYGLDSSFYVPFYKHAVFDPGIFMILFWTIVMVATSNAVNITDGLDGLATVPSIFALSSLALLVYITGNAVLSGYLLMPKIIEVGEVSIIGAALAGALIGFLWFNSHPAEVFMGDSGSLSVGAFMGYMAIISKSEILLILIGAIFVIETISVILQVGSYKTRGKRVFLMAPIHHHFEMKGWAENKIIVRFWIIALMSNLLALITLKVR
jgi:phospho-N-acetylmuramoyl-pentapeptide-transferase